MFNNLIDNSIKYAKNINIQLTKSNNNIIIIIDDDGPGIPKEEYENVFKPFYKIDKSRVTLNLVLDLDYLLHLI